MKNEWFATWFDTEYYHLLYNTRDDAEANRFIDNLMEDLKLPKNAYVLDLACGKGRHSRTLHLHDLDVLGVDLSENSIQCAKQFTDDNLHFMVHDMRNTLPMEFDAVFNLFTSFGYFDTLEDNATVIHSVHTMLKDNGLFVIDFMNGHKVARELVLSEVKSIGGIDFHIERKFDGNHIFKDISFKDKGEDYHFTERVQALGLSEFEGLLSAEGFEIVRTFGDFDLNPFNEQDSDRLIIVARK